MTENVNNSFLSLVAEIVMLWARIICYILEAFYHLVIPLPEKSLDDDIVLITGTGHGIGKCLAMQFAQVSKKVVCVDINEQINLETVNEINAKWKGKAYAYTCDISKLENVKELGKMVKNEVGTVTILVNNAGIMTCKSLEDHDEALIKKVFEINVFAHFWMLDTFLPGMKALNKGHVVFISSILGLVGMINLVPYCASKFAVRGLAEAIMDECRSDNYLNIHFTNVYPYKVNTGLYKTPLIRFPSLFPTLTPERTAQEIISAVRKNLLEITIPSSLLMINYVIRCYPEKILLAFKHFISGVDTHKVKHIEAHVNTNSSIK